jgi:anti-sigma-K factor RskA
MKKYLLTAALVAAFAVPASAASYYVMFDKSTKKCSISKSAPTETEKFSMMGIYGSEANAKMAMAGMMKCRK